MLISAIVILKLLMLLFLLGLPIFAYAISKYDTSDDMEPILKSDTAPLLLAMGTIVSTFYLIELRKDCQENPLANCF